MSIILTAGKRSVKPKSAKPKAKAKRSSVTQQHQQFDNSPPTSTERTAVWHWIMDGMTTTVIFTKETSEVWCNGVVLDTMDGFGEGDSGGVIDFCIFIEETQVAHKARIVRISKVTYQLYVDGYMIYDYVGQQDLQELPPLVDGTYSQQNGDCGAVGPPATYDYAPPAPPTYDEAIASGGYQQGN